MQSSFDFPLGDTSSSSRELQNDEDLLIGATRMISRDMDMDDMEHVKELEEALDNFQMDDTPNESRNDLEILSPIKLSMLSTQLLSTAKKRKSGSPPPAPQLLPPPPVSLPSSLKSLTGGDKHGQGRKSVVDRGGDVEASSASSVVVPRRPRKVVEFANFDDANCESGPGKQKRTDSTDAAIQAKIFAEIKK